MRALHIAAAFGVVLLVVIGAVVLGLGAAGVPVAVGPGTSASAVPTPAATAEQPSAEPSEAATPEGCPTAERPAPEDDVLAALAEIEEQVIAIRCLPAADIDPPELINREELGEELVRLFEEDYPPEEQERDNIALRALGMLEPGQDVAELQLDLLGDQVLGFYDDVEKHMVVVTESGLDANAKLTYAHEYTHALQDAAFGLDSLETDAVGEDDRGLARVALIEGDATVAMLAWALEHLSPQELIEIGSQQVPDTSGIPSWMVAQLQFPYTDGLTWATALAGTDPRTPDFAELDAAFADPPDSTEQIIDIAKWRSREDPIPVELPDLAAALGDGWEEVDETPIGRATIRMMLEYQGVPRQQAIAAGEGWGGDAAVIVSGPDDAFAVAWRLAWDTPADAAEFADAYRMVADGLPFAATVLELPDGEVLVVHASSDDIERRTVDAADD